MAKQKAKIEKWSVVGYNVDPYKAPEQAVSALVGLVKGHPRLTDGHQILTSPLTMISYRNRIAMTANTTYELGEPDPEFIQWLAMHGLSIEQYELGRLDA